MQMFKSPRHTSRNSSQEKFMRNYYENLNRTGLNLINKGNHKRRNQDDDDEDERIFERRDKENYLECWSETYNGGFSKNWSDSYHPSTVKNSQKKFQFVNQYSNQYQDVPVIQYAPRPTHHHQLSLSQHTHPIPLSPINMGTIHHPGAVNVPPMTYSPPPMKKSKCFGSQSQKNLHPSNEFVPPFIRASYKQNPKAIIDEIISPNNEGFGGLYLSDIETATDLALLDGVGVGAVLTLMIETDIEYPQHIASKNLKIDDLDNYNILPYFNEAFKFIDYYRTRTNVLVHCFAGISRSPTVVMGYIMKHLGCDFETAFSIVKEVRAEIDPNPGFIEQLKVFEEQINVNRVQAPIPGFQPPVAYAQPAVSVNPQGTNPRSSFGLNTVTPIPVSINQPLHHAVVPSSPFMPNYNSIGMASPQSNNFVQPQVVNSPKIMTMSSNGMAISSNGMSQPQFPQGAVVQNNYSANSRLNYTPTPKNQERAHYTPNPSAQTQVAMQLVGGRGSIELRPSTTPQVNGNISQN